MASCGVRHFALEYYHSPRGPHSAYTRPCIPAFQQSSNPAYGGVLCAPALPREQQTLAHQQVQAQDICVQPPLPNSPAQARNFIPAKACSSCQGSAFLCCQGCQGTGHLSRGGYQRKQSLPKELINSKWTAMAETVGWRHFRVKQLQKKGKGMAFVLMQASCDPSAQLWVNRDALRDRTLWAAGWVQMALVKDPQAMTQLGKGAPCRACRGTGQVACKQCLRAPAGTPLIQL